MGERYRLVGPLPPLFYQGVKRRVLRLITTSILPIGPDRPAFRETGGENITPESAVRMIDERSGKRRRFRFKPHACLPLEPEATPAPSP